MTKKDKVDLFYRQISLLRESWQRKHDSQYPYISLAEVALFNNLLNKNQQLIRDDIGVYLIGDDMVLASTRSDFKFVSSESALLKISMFISHIEHKYTISRYDDIINAVYDVQLRDRLKNILTNPEQELDAAVREVTVIVEDRIRDKSSKLKDFYGNKLIERALNNGTGILTSENIFECHGLCKIINKLFRNISHHEIIEGVPKEELRKAVIFVDEALSLINNLNEKI